MMKRKKWCREKYVNSSKITSTLTVTRLAKRNDNVSMNQSELALEPLARSPTENG